MCIISDDGNLTDFVNFALIKHVPLFYSDTPSERSAPAFGPGPELPWHVLKHVREKSFKPADMCVSVCVYTGWD